jgi:rod shape-determining protein MreB
MDEAKVLNIGIDLGTSKSVICSDNGGRGCVPSYVGFPKDAIAKKILGKEVLFGDEAIKHRLALNLYRPLELGVLKYSDHPEENPEGYQLMKDVARRLLQHLIEHARQEVSTEVITRAVIGAPALASESNRQALIEMATGVVDHFEIASEPFMVAYSMNLLEKALIIDVGAGTVDLCRMQGLFPSGDDQVTTYKGGDYIDNVFFDLLEARYPEANFTLEMLKRFKEANSTVSESPDKMFITLPVNGKPTPLDVTEELREACRAIVPEIVSGIDYLISTFDPEFQDELKENIVLAGGGSQIMGLAEELEKHMQEALGYGKVRRIADPIYAGANGALMYCSDFLARASQ